MTVAILVPPPGPVEDRTHTETDDGSELTAVIRVVDPDRDSVAPPLLPNGMAPQLDEPYGQIEIDMSDQRIADPKASCAGSTTTSSSKTERPVGGRSGSPRRDPTGMMVAMPELVGPVLPAGRLSGLSQPEIAVDELLLRRVGGPPRPEPAGPSRPTA